MRQRVHRPLTIDSHKESTNEWLSRAPITHSSLCRTIHSPFTHTQMHTKAHTCARALTRAHAHAHSHAHMGTYIRTQHTESGTAPKPDRCVAVQGCEQVQGAECFPSQICPRYSGSGFRVEGWGLRVGAECLGLRVGAKGVQVGADCRASRIRLVQNAAWGCFRLVQNAAWGCFRMPCKPHLPRFFLALVSPARAS